LITLIVISVMIVITTLTCPTKFTQQSLNTSHQSNKTCPTKKVITHHLIKSFDDLVLNQFEPFNLTYANKVVTRFMNSLKNITMN